MHSVDNELFVNDWEMMNCMCVQTQTLNIFYELHVTHDETGKFSNKSYLNMKIYRSGWLVRVVGSMSSTLAWPNQLNNTN